jgi:uncharacterized protein YkwD
MRRRSRALRLVGLFFTFTGALPSAAVACPSDETLDAVAVDVLLGDVDASPAALKRALASRGSSAMEAYVRKAESEAELALALVKLARRVALPLRCGRADADGTLVAVAAPDVALITYEARQVRGWLREGYSNAYLVFRDDDGRAHRVAVDAGALERGVPMPASFERHVPELQLVADTPRGPRPLARLPGPLPPGERPDDGASPAATIHAIRDAVRAPSLLENALLTREASEHAAWICDARHASHEGHWGNPESRLRARGIAARVVGEAVARARGVPEAMEAILTSPSHRAALEDRRFTDLGVGVAARGETRCVVALLAAFPRAVPPARPPNEVFAPALGRSID